MTTNDVLRLREQLSDRDLAVLSDIERFRLLSTRQLQRLHFDESHQTVAAGTRTCTRVLGRLQRHDLIRCLQRRIGGVRHGSAGYVWYLGSTGERLLRVLRGQPAPRHRYSEPSRHFVSHTLAVAELAVNLVEASRGGSFELLELSAEPANWRPYFSAAGVRATLKPDLAITTACGAFEDHWFVEADLDTEHMPVVMRQCLAYDRYFASGRYQAEHDVFPVVLWVVPTAARAHAIQAAIQAAAALSTALFRVCTNAEFIEQFAATGNTKGDRNNHG